MIEFVFISWTHNLAFDLFFNLVFWFTLSGWAFRAIMNVLLDRRY